MLNHHNSPCLWHKTAIYTSNDQIITIKKIPSVVTTSSHINYLIHDDNKMISAGEPQSNFQ